MSVGLCTKDDLSPPFPPPPSSAIVAQSASALKRFGIIIAQLNLCYAALPFELGIFLWETVNLCEVDK